MYEEHTKQNNFIRAGLLNTVLFLLIFDNIALKLEKVGLAIFSSVNLCPSLPSAGFSLRILLQQEKGVTLQENILKDAS